MAVALLFSLVLVILSIMSLHAQSIQLMSPERFWQIIDASAAHKSGQNAQVKSLSSKLSKLSPEEIGTFELAFQRAIDQAYTWDVWGAAYIIMGGASDDGFEYFRCRLISQGRRTFEAAVKAPDDLADLIAPDETGILEFEDFAHVAADVWGKKLGKNPYEDAGYYDVYRYSRSNVKPTGIRFEDSEEHLSKRYPKLWKRFGRDPLPRF